MKPIKGHSALLLYRDYGGVMHPESSFSHPRSLSPKLKAMGRVSCEVRGSAAACAS
jgi:hypothetical protein